MKIQFYAYLRDPEYAGCKEMTLSGVNTLRELGEELSRLFGPRFRGEFFSPDESELGERIIIMVNGRRAEFLSGIDTPLKDSDTVLIFPIVAGG